MSDIEYTDRYGGGSPPTPTCTDQCEGTGFVPIHESDNEQPWATLWKESHTEAGKHDCDGYHFVRCPTCGGSGTQPSESHD
jgi:hypothetical protein